MDDYIQFRLSSINYTPGKTDSAIVLGRVRETGLYFTRRRIYPEADGNPYDIAGHYDLMFDEAETDYAERVERLNRGY